MFSVASKRNSAVFELQVLPVLTQNQDIWNFYGSLTLNNGNLVGYFGNPWYAILFNRSHFLIFCSIEENICLFLTIGITCTNTKSRHLEFLRLTDLKKEKLIGYFGSPWYAILLNRSHVFNFL